MSLTNEELSTMFSIPRWMGDDSNGKPILGRLIPASEILNKLNKADELEAKAKQAIEADRAIPTIKGAGLPGSAERIEAMAAFMASQKEGEEVSLFDISDDEIAERVSGLLGISPNGRHRAVDMYE